MSALLSIDPGVHAAGWAFFDSGVLRDVGVARGGTPWEIVCSIPGSYLTSVTGVALESMEAGGSRVPPQDLIEVQTVGAYIAGWTRSPITLLRPMRWKGSIPKPIHHERIRAALDPAETEALARGLKASPKAHGKEIMDAVGIGLFRLRRIGKGGIRVG